MMLLRVVFQWLEYVQQQQVFVLSSQVSWAFVE
jgi:hypothetical protein